MHALARDGTGWRIAAGDTVVTAGDVVNAVGAWPEHPGFWFVAGPGGSGIETAPALAAFAAAVVGGGPLPVDVPLERAVLSPTRL